MSRAPRFSRVTLALGALGGALVVFLILPVVGLVSGTSFADARAGLGHPLVAPALELSLVTTALSVTLVVVLGTPLAWLVARTPGRATRWLESSLKLPVVLPPAVA